MIWYVYIYCSEKYNIMKVNLGCVFKCIYKHYILVLVTYMHTGSAYDHMCTEIDMEYFNLIALTSWNIGLFWTVG